MHERSGPLSASTTQASESASTASTYDGTNPASICEEVSRAAKELGSREEDGTLDSGGMSVLLEGGKGGLT